MLHTLTLISHTLSLKMSQMLGCYTHLACYTNTPMQMLPIISQMSPTLTQMSQPLDCRLDIRVLFVFPLSWVLFGYMRSSQLKPVYAKRGKIKAMSQNSARSSEGVGGQGATFSPSLFQGMGGHNPRPLSERMVHSGQFSFLCFSQIVIAVPTR